jgi:hypothetical protein
MAIRKREEEIARRPISLDAHPRWEQRIEVIGKQLLFNLRSGQGSQQTNNLCVTVEEPGGHCITKQLAVGETTISESVYWISYPRDFPNAPPTTAGRYRIKWQSEVSGTPRTVASAEYDVVIPSASASA